MKNYPSTSKENAFFFFAVYYCPAPRGTTIALAFVLFVSGVKAAVEDVRMHREDTKINNLRTIRLTRALKGTQLELHSQRTNDNGASSSKVVVVEETSTRWRDVRVGDLLVVHDGESFPADMLLLHSSLPEQVCFVQTTSLDGETNLKVRSGVPVVASNLDSSFDPSLVCVSWHPRVTSYSGAERATSQ